VVSHSRKPLPPSLYADTARPPVTAPPLDGDPSVSVAVVGAGFTGLSAGLHLADAGTDCIVIDAHEPGWGASGRNGGQVNPGLKHEPDEIEQTFGPDLGGRMITLSGGAPGYVFELIERHQIQCEAVRGGTIRAAISEAALGEVRAAAEQWSRRSAPVTFFEGAALEKISGARRYRGAFIDRRGGSLNPLGYARGLADAAQRAGARIHGGTPALKIAREGGRWRIDTPSGAVRAEQVIIGTNGYTDGLWPRLGETVVPAYSAIAATEPLSPEVAADILPERSVLYENSNFYAYYRLDAKNRLLMGGRSRIRDTSDPADFRHLTRYALRLYPKLGEVRWTHFWNGQVAITTDHYPHLHEPAPGVHIGLGYNGRGVAMATAMGRLLARRALGAAPAALDMPITSIKPIPLHVFWRVGVMAQRTAGRIKGWLYER
jgi:glycine/D-amino acid oxidase-like deaminating enzyme